MNRRIKMRLLVVVALLLAFVSFMAGAKDAAKKAKAKKAVVTTEAEKKAGAPCETKEDILKKLEEEKKAKEAGEKPKAFSLQGGNTGCSVK